MDASPMKAAAQAVLAARLSAPKGALQSLLNFPVIGFAGRAGAGKSTAATIFGQIALERDCPYVRIKFADGLKNMVRTMLRDAGAPAGHLERYIEGGLKEDPTDYLGGFSPRLIMQTLGTQWGRDTLHPDLWVRLWEQRAGAQVRRNLGVIVDDVRFPNEAEAIWRMGGLVIEVQRPTYDPPLLQSQIGEGQLTNDHFDYWVKNDGSEAQLRATITAALR